MSGKQPPRSPHTRLVSKQCHYTHACVHACSLICASLAALSPFSGLQEAAAEPSLGVINENGETEAATSAEGAPFPGGDAAAPRRKMGRPRKDDAPAPIPGGWQVLAMPGGCTAAGVQM